MSREVYISDLVEEIDDIRNHMKVIQEIEKDTIEIGKSLALNKAISCMVDKIESIKSKKVEIEE